MHLRSLAAAIAGLALAVPAVAQGLSLDEAVRLSEGRSARLAAQRHSVDAAREQVDRSKELPDPRLKFGLENLPVTGPDKFRYDRDFMTSRSVSLMQEFPNESKREARGLRAARARDVEQAGLAAQGTLLRRDTAAAWFDAYYAEQVKAALARLAGQFALQSDSIPAGIARGRMGAGDSYQLRLAHEQVKDRVIDAERVLAKARITLAAFVGDEADRALAAPPDTARLAHARELYVERLTRHPTQRLFDEREALAQAEVELARASKKSDWSVEVGYGQRRPYFDNQLSVLFAIDLPMQAERRQDRDIASRLAELERVRAEREDARRMHEAEVKAMLADFDAATRRIERLQSILLPLSRARRDLALAAYRGARGELAPVLEAERGITETELALVQALAERAKAWTALHYLDEHGEAK